jgi:peptidyl-prolyl cis-trans isomerase A (cyclophilin A)
MNPKRYLLPLLALFLALTLIAAGERADQAAAPATTQTASTAPAPPEKSPLLLTPEKATAKAPDTFKVRVTTTKGDVVIEVHRAWAPNGADRFYNLVQIGYFNGAPIFRVITGFMAQFGINPDPAVNAKWQPARIPDDPAAGQSNKRGIITFATSGPNSRTTQLFINFADNAMLDSQGFTPFGKVVSGMDVVDAFYSGYGEGAPRGRGPDQGRLQHEGSAYTKASYPKMDYITAVKIEP